MAILLVDASYWEREGKKGMPRAGMQCMGFGSEVEEAKGDDGDGDEGVRGKQMWRAMALEGN